MNLILYKGIEYTDDDIVSAELFSEISPISETLGYGTFSAVVKSTTALLSYEANTPIEYYYNGSLFGTYFINRITRTGKQKYQISAYDILGVLAGQQHMGGVYTGDTAETVIRDICGDIPILFDDTIKNTPLYGWLPIASRRDNLRRALFAVGAVAKATRSGELQIAVLSRHVVAQVNKIGVGAEVDYPLPVKSVSLTEHQFIRSARTEETELFDGITEEGDVITFDEPVYDVTASGIAVVEAHANYIVVGAGNGTVSGKKYVHTKRELVQLTGGTGDEAVYDDATLVSVTNSAAVLDRLVGYHKQTNVISANVRHEQQTPGDVLRVLHPYDLNLVNAFLLDDQITVGRKLLSYQRLLIGYIPPNPTEGIYNHVDVIASDGVFVVPDGVTRLRVVMIGGGTGGESGLPGEAAPANTTEEGDYVNNEVYKRSLSGSGGWGGSGGKAGTGGKIYQRTIEVEPGQEFEIKTAAGGIGGSYEISNQNAGTVGGDSSFGIYSSADGGRTENGFFEEISGVQYAVPGVNGVSGGKGAGVENREPVEGTNVTYKAETYYPGESKYEKQIGDAVIIDNRLYTQAVATGGFGGGPTGGANGTAAELPISATARTNGASAFAGAGGAGASATKPPVPDKYGVGGDGGNGGGGGGAGGTALVVYNKVLVPNAYATAGPGTPGAGGAGAAGGDGAPGCVLVYYYLPLPTDFNLFMLADGAYLKTADGVDFMVEKE